MLPAAGERRAQAAGVGGDAPGHTGRTQRSPRSQDAERRGYQAVADAPVLLVPLLRGEEQGRPRRDSAGASSDLIAREARQERACTTRASLTRRAPAGAPIGERQPGKVTVSPPCPGDPLSMRGWAWLLGGSIRSDSELGHGMSQALSGQAVAGLGLVGALGQPATRLLFPVGMDSLPLASLKGAAQGARQSHVLQRAAQP